MIHCDQCGGEIGEREITEKMNGDYGLRGALLVVQNGTLIRAQCKLCRTAERQKYLNDVIGYRIYRGSVIPASQSDMDWAIRNNKKFRVFKTAASAERAMAGMARRGLTRDQDRANRASCWREAMDAPDDCDVIIPDVSDLTAAELLGD